MKDQFLKIAGVKTQKEFYNKYPSEEAFFRAHPEAQHLKTMARGGSTGSAQQQQVMRIIQAYAQAQGVPPKQIMDQLQQMQPQQQQQALQQMAQAVSGGPASAMQQQMQPQQTAATAPGYGSGAMPMGAYGMQVMAPGGSYEAQQQLALQQIQQQANAATSSPAGAPFQTGSSAYNKYLASQPQQAAPTQTAASAAPLYSGNSIVDLLAGQGKAFDKASRKKLAASLNMNNYNGTADQNQQLIDMINANPDVLKNIGSEDTMPRSTSNKSKNAKDASPKTMGEAALIAGHKPDYYGTPSAPYDKNDVIDYDNLMSRPWMERGMNFDSDFDNMIYRPYNFNEKYQTGNLDGPILGHQFVNSKYLGKEFKNTPEGDKRAAESKKASAESKKALKDYDHDPKVGVPYPNKLPATPVVNLPEHAIAPWESTHFSHGGYYGNVPQHARPGTYADGYSGTSNAGQYFDLGGMLGGLGIGFNSRNPFGDIGEGMRDGSLVQTAASILPMAGMENKWAYKNSTGKDLKGDLTKYLANNPNATKEDISKMLGSYADGGTPIPHYNFPSAYNYNQAQPGFTPQHVDSVTYKNMFNQALANPSLSAQPYINSADSINLHSQAYNSANAGKSPYIEPARHEYLQQMLKANAIKDARNIPQHADGGMAAAGYVPEYGSQAYAPSFANGGVPLPLYRSAGPYYPDGGQISPEEQAAMAQQGAPDQSQQAPPDQSQPGADQGQQQAPDQQQGGGQDQQQIVQAIAQMLQQGIQPDQILQRLVQMGVPQDQAQQLLQAVMQQMQGGQPQQGPQQGPQEEQAEGPQGQEAPQQEAAEGQPGMMYGGNYAYGGVSNLHKFVGRGYPQQPDLEQIHNSYMKARGGMIGHEMEVSPSQLEELRKQGYKFDLI